MKSDLLDGTLGREAGLLESKSFRSTYASCKCKATNMTSHRVRTPRATSHAVSLSTPSSACVELNSGGVISDSTRTRASSQIADDADALQKTFLWGKKIVVSCWAWQMRQSPAIAAKASHVRAIIARVKNTGLTYVNTVRKPCAWHPL